MAGDPERGGAFSDLWGSVLSGVSCCWFYGQDWFGVRIVTMKAFMGRGLMLRGKCARRPNESTVLKHRLWLWEEAEAGRSLQDWLRSFLPQPLVQRLVGLKI